MQCLYCGTQLSLLRTLANGEFCCDEHRELHESDAQAGTVHSLSQFGEIAPRAVEKAPLQVNLCYIPPKPPDPRKPSYDAALTLALLDKAGRVPLRFPQALPRQPKGEAQRTSPALVAFSHNPLIPNLDIAPVSTIASPAAQEAPAKKRWADGSHIDLSTQRLREIWRAAPDDLKLITLVIPLLLVLVINATTTHIHHKSVAVRPEGQPMIDGFLSRQWAGLRRTILERAGFDYADDFHSGLDNWQTRNGVPPAWAYDKTGFVRPGPLALYRPTMQMADYRFDFMGTVDPRARGIVFRAADSENYYGYRLVMVKPKPLPEMHVIHYAVVNGKESLRSETPLPLSLSSDTFFRAQIDVRGSDFTLMVENKVADFWSDNRLKTGGVGFFCGRGEEARLRWVDVSHQYDTLGRLCAYLAPYGLQANGSVQ